MVAPREDAMEDASMRLRRRALVGAALASGALAAAPVRAQGGVQGTGAWPTRPIRLIVPYSPAGASDVVMRMLAERLTPALGQPVVIENRAGLAGTIGTDAAAKSAPDGYTVVNAAANQTINETLQPRRPFRLLRDLVPIAGVNSFALALAVNNALPVRDVPELIGYGRANPGKLNYASSGPGSVYHLAAELFRFRAGIEMQHIPFRNYNEARTALLANQINLMFDGSFSLASLIGNGSIRGLATTGRERTPLLPDLPLVADTLPGYEMAQWNGLLGPAGIPRPIVERLNAEVNTILADPRTIEEQRALGATTMRMSPAEFGAFLQREIDAQREVIGRAGVQPET